MQMSEFQVIPNPIFHDTNKTVEELFSNNSLQFAYYEVNPDRMMGFTAETEDVTIIIYVISGSVYITTPDGKIKVSSHTSIVLDNIQHTYMLVANEVSQLLVFTNTEKVQHIDAANVFRKIINEIEQKDIYTIGHSHRVRKYSSAIALALDPAYDIIPLATAAGLHDVGKIKVPKEILQKPGKLTQEEYQIIKKHPIDTYELLKEYFPDKRYLTTSMRQEAARCRMAFEEAAKGAVTAMVCSGDAGIYGMAGLMYEIGEEYPEVAIEVIPGVTAALGGSAVLGAAVGHDVSLISLSDLLTPWELIEERLLCAAKADFVICLYNPSSRKRSTYLAKACEIMLEYKAEDTVCGIVKNIAREGETMQTLTLKELKETTVDMFSTVFIGNKQTKVIKDKMVTPRGYRI